MSKSNGTVVEVEKATSLKLDLGCGPNPKEGFEGVDQYPFDGKVKHVCDIRKPWKWKDNSVDEANASHFVEHLTAMERVAFFNELFRVLKPGSKATIIVPHWGSCRAYGDPTHQWPPVSEFSWLYLNRQWRMGDEAKKLAANAPHTDAKHMKGGFTCDFDHTYGYSTNPAFQAEGRNEAYVRFALSWYREAAMDMIVTLAKR